MTQHFYKADCGCKYVANIADYVKVVFVDFIGVHKYCDIHRPVASDVEMELTDLKRRLREAVDEIDEEMLKMFNKVDQWGTMTGMVYANILRKHLHIELEMVSDTNQQEE